MAAVERFEQLECWQSARELVRAVYHACETGKLAKDFETRAQFKRAALSGMNNIAEGFGRRFSGKEFIRFLGIAQGSLVEVKSMTYVLEDVFYCSSEVVIAIREKTDITLAKTIALIKYLRSRPQK
jgi:four helix bundle protein